MKYIILFALLLFVYSTAQAQPNEGAVGDTIIPVIEYRFGSDTVAGYKYFTYLQGFVESKPDTVQGIIVSVVNWESATIQMEYGSRVTTTTLRTVPFYCKRIEQAYYNASGNLIPDVVWFIKRD